MAIPIHIVFARELRKNLTPEERLVWDQLRSKKLKGYKFLRQHPIMVRGVISQKAFYIADFYCADKKLVIEIDGGIHAFQIDYDEARDIVMKEMGLTVIRIKNEEVNGQLPEVLDRIEYCLNSIQMISNS